MNQIPYLTYQFSFPELINLGKNLLETDINNLRLSYEEYVQQIKTISRYMFVSPLVNYTTPENRKQISALAQKSVATKLIAHLKTNGCYEWVKYDLLTSEIESSKVNRGSLVHKFLTDYISSNHMTPINDHFKQNLEDLCCNKDPLVYFIIEDCHDSNASILEEVVNFFEPYERDILYFPRKFLEHIFSVLYFDMEGNSRVVEGQMKAQWFYLLIGEEYADMSDVEVNMKVKGDFLVVRYFLNDELITSYINKNKINPMFTQVYKYLSI